jgi:3-phosphoshikimate 1-carboxyvinyltransferase
MIEISQLKDLDSEIMIPGSKYAANRALIISALANGVSKLSNVPENKDIANAINALKNLGVEILDKNGVYEVKGTSGKFSPIKNELDVGDSGTLLRFVIALSTLSKGNIKITGSKRIQERPISELLISLGYLGVKSEKLNGDYVPAIIKGGTFIGGKTLVSGKISSQFLSALLLVSPYAKNDVEIEVTSEMVSKSYVDLTIYLMKYFGVNVTRQGYKRFKVASGQIYKSKDYDVPVDCSSANYFFAAASMIPGKIKIRNFDWDLAQPEIDFLKILEKMGAEVKRESRSIVLLGPDKLKGIEIDMSSMPDSVQTLAVVALFAEGKTIISGISHLKYKESDRINDTCSEFKKLGAKVRVTDDKMFIEKGPIKGGIIDPHNDHRMAMSFALIGLKVKGIKIENPECVDKSFPEFFDTLKKIGVQIKNA